MSPPDPGPVESGTAAPDPGDDNPYDLLAEDHDEGHRWALHGPLPETTALNSSQSTAPKS